MFWPDFGSHLHCRMGRDIVHTDRDPNSIPSSYLSFRMFFCVLSCVTHTHSSFFGDALFLCAFQSRSLRDWNENTFLSNISSAASNGKSNNHHNNNHQTKGLDQERNSLAMCLYPVGSRVESRSFRFLKKFCFPYIYFWFMMIPFPRLREWKKNPSPINPDDCWIFPSWRNEPRPLCSGGPLSQATSCVSILPGPVTGSYMLSSGYISISLNGGRPALRSCQHICIYLGERESWESVGRQLLCLRTRTAQPAAAAEPKVSWGQ